jgi:exopolyphosphatase/guanosine-5'-triphosphate,3'-diphosphate pyrophosphatase
MRIAAIDIGTNSVRSVIVDVPVGGPRVLLDDEKAYTRLGRGLLQTGLLSRESIDDTIEAMRRMLDIAEQFEVSHMRAVATAAVRDAENGSELIDLARERLGVEIEVISPEEEGRLAFLSAVESADLEGRSAVIDIGGGSVEVVRSTGREIEFITSLPLGAVLLSERYHTEDPMPRRDYRRLTKYVRGVLEEALGDDPDPVATLVGSGGTINAVAAMISASAGNNLPTLHGYETTRADVIHLLARLARSTAVERRAIKGLPEQRADIIVAGTLVIDELMRLLGANVLRVNTRGIREGVVVDTIARERGSSERPERMDAARAFGQRCHCDFKHAEHVRMLAMSLFDGVADPLGLPRSHAYLLEAAALVHDVGYLIGYERHHKHSYHLITYSELPGFSRRDLQIIAGIARYHRGALPKTRHEALLDLSADDRELVVRLGALLRIADGLDRSRAQRIASISVKAEPHRVVVHVEGRAPLDVEVHGACRKSDLFERAFGLRFDVEATELAAPASSDAATGAAQVGPGA